MWYDVTEKMCIRDRATRANLSELQVKEIIPTLTIAPDITKVVIPQGSGYLILDKNFNELYSLSLIHI